MEEGEIEMSEEELQKWIKEEVHKSKLVSPDVLEKCNMLQSLLEKRENQAAQLLKLCESVAACKAMVKKQYSLLGWEYVDTHSDDADANITDCGTSTQSLHDSIHSATLDSHSSATKEPHSYIQNLQYSEDLGSNKDKTISFCLKRNPVVVLTRLPECKISVVHTSAPKNDCRKKESLSRLNSDMYWESENDLSHSDCSVSHFKTGSKQMRKFDKKPAKRGATPQVNSNTEAKRKALKRNATTSGTKPSMPEASKNDKAKINDMKISSKPIKGNDLVLISSLCQDDGAAQKASPSEPQDEICVDMSVLARRGEMNWQQGHIKEINTKDDGRVKYKVFFEKKGKRLVSGHHIAFYRMPKAEQLVVGTRVVFKHPDKLQFYPGILAEIPTRRNRLRFLVFTDDHKVFYAGLPLLYLVYKPLPDPLDDIVDETHRSFMKEYLERWPYPLQVQYKVGHVINAELNGVLEKCEVQVIDCSLIQVKFQRDQHKDWIYRGSMRLEQILYMRNCQTSDASRPR